MSETLFEMIGVAKFFGERTLFQDVNVRVNRLARIGLVGSNGAGKSTLLGIMAGVVSCDAGRVQWVKPDCTLHYLTQARDDPGLFVRNDDEADDARPVGRPVSDHMERYVLTKRLGLSQDTVELGDEAVMCASGGERTRLAIAAAWSAKADLMILDEPTNHLDADGIAWLIGEIKKYPGTVMIVSHDRYFLDQAVDEIVELRDGKVRVYVGNYSIYEAQRAKERDLKLREYELQQGAQARIEEQIAQLKQWAQRAHEQAGKQGTLSERRQMGLKQYQRAKAKKLDRRVKSQIQRLEKLRDNEVEKPEKDQSVHFDTLRVLGHGRRLIEAKNLVKSFGDRVIFQESDFYVARGERVGLMGQNGCGNARKESGDLECACAQSQAFPMCLRAIHAYHRAKRWN